MALKDWNKITWDDGSYNYVNRKRRGTLYIGEKCISITIDTVTIRSMSFTRTHIHEEFKNKLEALKFARAFMKNN